MQYLKVNRNVSETTIKKYLSAIGVVTSHLNNYGYNLYDLFEVDSIDELNRIKDFLFSNQEFVIKDKTGNRMYSAAFNHFYKFSCEDAIFDKEEISKLDIILPKPTNIGQIIINKRKRNQIIVAQVLKSTHHSCEYDINHKSFISNKTKMNYVEGHHIIPLEKQEKFDINLDIYANITSLCPTCHRLLHYGIQEEKAYVLTKLYIERKDRLKNSGINISLRELMEFVR